MPFFGFTILFLYLLEKRSFAILFLLLNEIAKQHDIESFYGRIFTAYGEGQSADNLLPSLKKAALNGDDFVLNKAHNIRDFIEQR